MNEDKSLCNLIEDADLIYKYVDSFSPEVWYYDRDTLDISIWKVLNFDKKWCSLGDMAYPYAKNFKEQSTIPAMKHVLVQALTEGVLIHPDGASEIWNSKNRRGEGPLGTLYR